MGRYVPKVLAQSASVSRRKWLRFSGVAGDEEKVGGADGVRTRDLIDAIDARSQLRYGPTVLINL